MTARAENINPEILTWAREIAGLTVDSAAKKLQLTSTSRSTASEKLEAFERGDVKPTRNQLVKISEIYRCPLTVFYLNSPPKIRLLGTDFRTVYKVTSVSLEEAATLNAILRDVHVRQEMVKSILEDDEDHEPLDFVESVSPGNNVKNTVSSIKKLLGVDNLGLIGKGFKSPKKLFAFLREKIENTGVFVLLIGDLGSHHSAICEQAFRGFTIADKIAPFIVINHQDALSARSFTLMHEFTPLMLGSAGISGAPRSERANSKEAQIERFCNDVAAEFLIPEEVVYKLKPTTDKKHVAKVVAALATEANVSESTILYRLWRSDRISAETYRTLSNSYERRWQHEKEKRRNRLPKQESSGSNHYTIRRHRLGKPLLELVHRSLRENELTHTKAGRILSVSPTSVERLLEMN